MDRVKDLWARVQDSRLWRAWTRYGDARGNLLAGGVAYYSDGRGWVFAVDARTGQRLWARNASPGGYYSHEVCGAVVLANNGPVEVLGREAGDARGRLFPDDETALMMATDGAQAFVSTTKGVYAFDCG